VIGDVGLSVVTNDADQEQWYEFVMAVRLVADVTRYRADGSVLNHARANYTLCRRDGLWKVVLAFPLLEEGFNVPVLPIA
jgi:hypothetical protein